MYGVELILDVHSCNTTLFNRKDITVFLETLCSKIDMVVADRHFWDDEGLPESQRETLPHLKGTSVIQFIKTSSIVIHTLELLGALYFNCFSCKYFDPKIVSSYVTQYFGGNIVKESFIQRM